MELSKATEVTSQNQNVFTYYLHVLNNKSVYVTFIVFLMLY